MQNITAYIIKLLTFWVALATIVFVVITQLHENEEPSETIPSIVLKPVDSKQLTCLAENIYYEAGSETFNGQAAVARVVINRIRYGFANTPCNVIHQFTLITKINEDTLEEYKVKVCQFSWVCENKPKPKTNDPKYQQALQIAYDVLSKDAYIDIVPKSALFFHNLNVDPLWPYRQVAKIGNHIFYSKNKKTVTKPTNNGQNI